MEGVSAERSKIHEQDKSLGGAQATGGRGVQRRGKSCECTMGNGENQAEGRGATCESSILYTPLSLSFSDLVLYVQGAELKMAALP